MLQTLSQLVSYLLALAYVLLWVAAFGCIVYIRLGWRWAVSMAVATTFASWGLVTGGLVGRALAAGHWPLTNRYEFALCLVWAILSIYLLLQTSWREWRASAMARGGPDPTVSLRLSVLLVSLLAATYALLRPAEERLIRPLLPALRSPWLQVHVLSAMVGYAALSIAAGLALTQLVRQVSAQEDGQHVLDTRIDTGPQVLISVNGIERTMIRVVSLGFPWLTLSILSGAIWAQRAWGRYWGWDPKETWALVTWLWYLLILHVWPLRGWRGRRLAGLIVVGFGLVLFTFVGVPWVVRTVRLESLHGF